MYNIIPPDSRLCAKRGFKEQVQKIKHFPHFTQSKVTASAKFLTFFWHNILMQRKMSEQQLNLDPQTLREEQNVSTHCHSDNIQESTSP